MSLLSLLTQSMGSQSSVNSLAKKTGVSSTAVQMLIAAAVPMLIKSLTKNASSKDGIASLLGALTQHTSTKALADQIDEADEEDGNRIIGHIFGNNQNDIVSQLAGQTGLNNSQVTSLLGNMAPALLSSLSAAKQESAQAAAAQAQAQASSGGLGGLGSLLGGLFGGSKPAQPAASAGLGMLNSIFGGAGQSAGAPEGGLLDILAAKNDDDDDDDANGSNLLSSLLNFKF